MFDCDELALELGEFGGRLTVATDKECCGPKDDYGSGGSQTVVSAFLILGSRYDTCASRDALRPSRPALDWRTIPMA